MLFRITLLAVFTASAMQTPAATVLVEMRNNFFSPAEVTINVGDTVTWVQRGSNHDTVSYDGIWESELLRLNQTFSFTFTTPGDFRYYCTPHEQIGMIGTIHVQGGGQNTPPTVALTAPANNATFLTTDTITFSASASDDGTIAKVEFFAGANLIGTDTSAPYSVTGSLAAGTHSITAKATDDAGASTTSSAVNITIEGPGNQAPTVTLTSSAAGVLGAPASLVLSATAADADGSVAQVEFLNGDTLLGADTSAPYELPLSDLAPGVYSIRAAATDNAGARTVSLTVTLSVATPPRITSITRNGNTTIVAVTATTGIPHMLEATEDFTTWNEITTNTPADGSVTFNIDANGTKRLYRVVAR